MAYSYGIEYNEPSLKKYFSERISSKTIKEFLKRNPEVEDLMLDNKWNDLFSLFTAQTGLITGVLVCLFILADIDFLPYMHRIPRFFIPKDVAVYSIEIPTNIKELDIRAFSYMKTKIEIKYKGTKEQWEKNIHLIDTMGNNETEVPLTHEIYNVSKIEYKG